MTEYNLLSAGEKWALLIRRDGRGQAKGENRDFEFR